MEVFQDLEQLETKEKELFFAIYKEYQNRMYWAAFQILKHESDAEDVVQDTFLALLDHMEPVTGKEPYKVWNYILTIVKHKAFNLIKKKQIWGETELEEWYLEEETGQRIEQQEVQKGVANDLEALLRELKYPYGEVLQLQYFHEMSITEIAEILEKSEDNIRHISMRAKDKMRKILEERGITRCFGCV